MNDNVLNECMGLIKYYDIYDEYVTDGEFDINKFKNGFIWYLIAYHRISFSEEFIREFKDYVSWECVSLGQTLSEEFICEHLNQININKLFKNKNIKLTKEFKDKIKVLKMLIE